MSRMLARGRRKADPDGGEGTFEVSIAGGPTLRVSSGEFLLAAALAQGLAYPHNCRVGTCGSCKTRLISGEIKSMMDFALSPLTAEELRAGYVLACQSKVRSDLVIEVTLDEAAATQQTVEARIARIERLPGDVLHLQLALATPLQFGAGQYADLGIEGFEPVHAYSFCDAPSPGGNHEVSFLIERLLGGEFSERLFLDAVVGMSMYVHGPFGHMSAAELDANAVCVADGTGLAPILSILRHRLAASATARFTLLLGGRTQTDHFATRLLEAVMQEAGGRLAVELVLSEEPADSDWTGPRGLVTEALEARHVAAADCAFVCGSQDMVHAAQRRLVALGIPLHRIHADAFLPSDAALR
jgi:toluene methyl-monooxygenase electron transfer component